MAGVNSGRAVAGCIGVPRRNGVAVGVTVAEEAGVSGELVGVRCLAVAVGGAIGEPSAAADGNTPELVVSVPACAGFTNIFDGASGGGVASDFIFARAFSAACRSAIVPQP